MRLRDDLTKNHSALYPSSRASINVMHHSSNPYVMVYSIIVLASGALRA